MTGPALFGTWARANRATDSRASKSGLKYRVTRGPDWCGHPRWKIEPQAVPTTEAAHLADAARRAGKAAS